MQKFDVLFIGSGQGAWNGAIPMAQKGLNVAVVEEDKFGGVCSNRGCNAKILLDRPFLLKRLTSQMKGRVFENDLSTNWSDLMRVKKEIIGQQDHNNRTKLERNGVQVIKGHANFVDNGTIDVAGTTYSADKIVIATGTRPHRLDIPGQIFCHTSDDFLDLEVLPEKIVIVGGGLIAVELASISAEAGAEVTLLVRDSQVLKDFYQPYVEHVIADLRKLGVKILYNTEAREVLKLGSEFTLVTANEQMIATNYVIDATGRVANSDRLDLEKTDVQCDERGWIKVDEHLMTDAQGIYATGDVTNHNQPDITPVAAFESKYLGHIFNGETTETIVYPYIPRVVFTIPRIAQFGTMPIGKVVDGHDEAGHMVKVLASSNDWFKLIQNEVAGEITLVYDDAGILIGAAAIGYEAEDEINGLLPYAQLKMDRQAMDQFVWLFPSLQYMTSRNV